MSQIFLQPYCRHLQTVTSAVAILILLSCCQKEHVPFLELNYDLDERHFDNLAPDTKQVSKLGICDLVAADWDSMIILRPYIQMSRIEALKLKYFTSIEDEVENLSYHDGTNTLLFTKSNEVVAYSSVDKGPVNFSRLMLGEQDPYVIIKKSECKDIYIEKKQYKIGASYDIYRAQDSKE